MARFELVLCERNVFGEKTDKKTSFVTNDAAHMADMAERESLKSVRKNKRERARDEFYGGPARPLA